MRKKKKKMMTRTVVAAVVSVFAAAAVVVGSVFAVDARVAYVVVVGDALLGTSADAC